MPQPQLSIRSARAKILAHSLAKRERRSVSQVVEQALENYAKESSAIENAQTKESAHDFWDRMTRDFSSDVDLEKILQEHHQPHLGPEL